MNLYFKNSSEKKRRWIETISEEDKENLPEASLQLSKRTNAINTKAKGIKEAKTTPILSLSREFLASVNRITLPSSAVYDDCEQVRRLAKAFLEKESVGIETLSNILCIEASSLRIFLEKEGSFEGVDSPAYLPLYYFLEKLRVSSNQVKSADRLASERDYPSGYDIKALCLERARSSTAPKKRLVWIGSR